MSKTKAIACPACGCHVFAAEWHFEGWQLQRIYTDRRFTWIYEESVEGGEYVGPIECDDCGEALPEELAAELRSEAVFYDYDDTP
jgi:ssDNA-binding Zn-finger/Zn-ribbon topoisomerase 1